MEKLIKCEKCGARYSKGITLLKGCWIDKKSTSNDNFYAIGKTPKGCCPICETNPTDERTED